MYLSILANNYTSLYLVLFAVADNPRYVDLLAYIASERVAEPPFSKRSKEAK
jgi:hypothetical protein